MGVAVVGFYMDEEVIEAKQLLHEFAESLDDKPDGLPRFKRRAEKDCGYRRRAECDDLLKLFAALDASKVTLPTYVAANLQRLPSVSPGEVDVYGLAAAVQKLTAQVDSLSKQVVEAKKPDEFNDLSMRVKVLESSCTPSASYMSTDETPSSDSTAITSWATTAVCGPDDLERMNRRKPPVKTRVRGSAVTTSVKGVPRVPTVAAFVGRLDLNTGEADLTAMLTDAGVKVVRCTRLKQKPGATYQWKTAAFFVSCEESCQDIFYKEDIWPEGAELRDWYFKS